MNRKERILTAIIHGLRVTTTLGPYGSPRATSLWSSDEFAHDDMEGHYVHFAPWLQPQPGMIVMCKTSAFQMHDWVIAEVVKVLGMDRCLLKDLNTGRICDMSNEGFDPIIGLKKSYLWSEEQVEFERKVRKAFRQLDDWSHVYGGTDFDGREATVWVREKWGGLHLQNRESIPYPVQVHWTKRTTIKSIRESLLEAGYGEREFETRICLSKLGHSLESATVNINGGPVDICEMSHYVISGGHRLAIYMEQPHPILTRRIDEDFTLNLTAKNGEQFVVRVSGITKSNSTSYYKRGLDIRCKGVEVEQVHVEEV